MLCEEYEENPHISVCLFFSVATLAWETVMIQLVLYVA